MTSQGRDGGFTLIETLVAFAIATTAVGLLFQIHGNATRTIALAEDYRYVTELARALIAEHARADAPLDFDRAGVTNNRYAWQLSSREYGGSKTSHADGAADSGTGPGLRLREVTVRVVWTARDREREVTLETLRPVFEQDSEQ